MRSRHLDLKATTVLRALWTLRVGTRSVIAKADLLLAGAGLGISQGVLEEAIAEGVGLRWFEVTPDGSIELKRQGFSAMQRCPKPDGAPEASPSQG